MEMKLTPRQIEALLWAIDLTNASYDGWTNFEKGPETVADLKHLMNAEAKLLTALSGGNTSN